MSLLGFLKSAKVEEVVAPAKGGGGLRKERTPEGLTIRLFRNGSVYPSQALVEKFDLEYKVGVPSKVEVKNKVMDSLPAGAATEVDAPKSKTVFSFEKGQGNGLDVIDSRQWHQFKADGSLVFVSPVSKDEAKVDLFGIVRRDEVTGVPTESVMDQGAATYGTKFLIPMIKEIYGIELSEELDHVDLVVVSELEGVNITEAFSQEISLFPKVVARGDEKGKPDYERRDKAKVYGLIPYSVLVTENEAPEKTTLEEKPTKSKMPEGKASEGALIV